MRNQVLFVLILVLVSPLVASSADNSLKKGSWALQFAIDGNIRITSFQGNMISIKKHTADNVAYRLGVTSRLDLGSRSEASTMDGIPPNSTSQKDRTIQVSMNLLRMKYPNVQRTVNLYWGYGPQVGYYYNRVESPRGGNTITRQLERSNNWSVGLSGVLGVEWFAIPSISFIAEYSSSALYNRSTSNFSRTYYDGTSETRESKEDSFTISSSAVRFGVSAYF